jgi:hypothetical protein
MIVESLVADLTLEFVERLQLSSNAIIVNVIVDIEIRVVCVRFEHFNVVIGGTSSVDNNWIFDEFSLAKPAHPLMVAHRHCQEA